MKTLKVWGCRYFGYNMPDGGYIKQSRIIIAAYTKKQATEISGLPYTELTNYACLTGNKRELSIATEVGVWIYDNRKYSEYNNKCPIIRINRGYYEW
jgi:hypothetical protein